MSLRAIILTGGRSTRFGGRHKPAVEIEGISVLQRLVGALTEVETTHGLSLEITVAGSREGMPELGDAKIVVVREDPPFTGPLAGIARGVEHFSKEPDSTVLVLAGDLPFVTGAALWRLVETSRATQTVATPIDDSGYPQYLFAAWPERLLRRRLGALETVENQPVRRLYADVTLAEVQLDERVFTDIDSPEDLARWSK